MVLEGLRGSVSTFPYFFVMFVMLSVFSFFVAVAFFMCFTPPVSTDGVFCYLCLGE